MRIIPGAEEFYFKGGPIGCLLIHGFTGSPAEMRMLGEYLQDKGYTVYGIRLAGHGTSPDDMLRTDEQDWLQSAETGLAKISRACERIFVIGFSMGGLLALHVAAKYPVAGVAALSTPIFIGNRKLLFLPIYRLFRTYEPKPRKTFSVAEQYTISYDRTPLRCLSGLLRLIDTTKLVLSKINMPVLLMQSKADRTVRPESVEYLFNQLTGAHRKKLIWLHTSGHLIPIEDEREIVFAAVAEFAAVYGK